MINLNREFNFSGKIAGDAAELAAEITRIALEEARAGRQVSVRSDGNKVVLEASK
jgi:hypothetical protein